MIVVSLVPIGVLQAIESFENGFWSARSLDFYQRPIVKTLLWLRMGPDTIFILGVLPLLAAAAYGLFHMRGLRAPVETARPGKKESRELVGV
jgi:nitric oxide reductase subunit B